MKKSSWFIFCLILAVSCLDDPDCFRLNNNVVGFAFKVMGSARLDTVRLAQINISGTQSIVPDTVTASVFVPINFTTTTSKVTFVYEDGSSKYLNLDYLLRTQFISEDCGSRYELSNLSAGDTDLDSVRVLSREPGKATGAINIEVFRCPNPRYVGIQVFEMLASSDASIPFNTRASALPLDSITTDFSTDVFYPQSSRPIFYLPVNPDATQTVFNFYTRGGDPAQPQSLRVTYTTATQNSFPDLCPDVRFVDNLRIASNGGLADVDSLGVNDNNEFLDYITDPPSTNIRLYRCPQTNLAKLTFRKYTSAERTQSRDDTIAVKRITSDYAPTRVYAANRDLMSIALPVNPNADETTFYIEYTDSNIPTDTVRVSYTRTDRPSNIFSCGLLTTYTELTGVNNAVYIIVDPTNGPASSTLQNPPINTNIQVIHEANQ
jgi:hypothetical protein